MEMVEDLDYATLQAKWSSAIDRLSAPHQEAGGSNLMDFSHVCCLVSYKNEI